MATEREQRNWMAIAKEAALLAGRFLERNRESNIEISEESMRDIKITADFEAERIILAYLKDKSNFSILSEENGLFVGSDQRFIWIIDPLDGSLNYMRGIPLCCVSIGLWQDKSPVLGIVYEFMRSELFSGIVGKGAWLNDNPIKISSVDKRERAILCTGFPANTNFSSENINRFVDEVRSYRKIRLLGSAALSIVYVASGRADAYYEKDIMFWDIAGAIPVLMGAGGKTEMENASKIHSYHTYVSNGYLQA